MAALVAVVLMALIIQDIPLASYLRESEEQRLTTSLERDAFLLAGRSQAALTDAGEQDLAAVVAMADQYATASGARLVIVDRDGIAVATSDEGDADVGVSYASRPEFTSALSGVPASGERFSETLGGELLYAAVPVLSGDETVGAVRVTYDDRAITAAVNSKLGALVAVGLTTALLAAVIGLLLSGSITRRLRILRSATERFAAGDMDARADETSGAPELRSLAASFNSMAERIEGLIEQQRAFAGDASHQLRTPLTALRLRLERARQLTVTDPEAAAIRIEAAEAEVERLDALIEGLLVLSRADATTERSVIDLAAVAADRVETWNALAQESGSTVTFTDTGPAPVVAATTATEQIIDNLVDNALRAGGPGTTIIVSVRPAHERTELRIADDGPGLAEEYRQRAFDRFWRGRNDDQGSGLGLAIVAQLARASGATAELLGSDRGGIEALVRFLTVETADTAPPGEPQPSRSRSTST
ncbi:MAG: ATP-binding protein [Leifsonia sp.]